MDQLHSRRVWLYAQSISFGPMIFGYNLGVLNPSYKNVSKALSWGDNESLYLGLFQAMYAIGCMIGAMLSGSLWNRYGRRFTIFILVGACIIGGTLCCIPNNPSFGLGRIFSGIAGGMGLGLSQVFIMEISPSSMRAKTGSLIQINVSLGMAIAFCLGIPLPVGPTSSLLQHWWQFMYFFQIFMGLYLMLIFKFYYIYDSPTYYAIKGDNDRAILAYEFITGNSSPSLMMGTRVVEDKPTTKIIKFSELTCSKTYRVMLRIAIILSMLEQLCGVSAVVSYSTKILYEISGDIYISRILTSALGVIKVFSSFLVFPLIRNFGRKTLIVGSVLTLGVLDFIFGLITSVANYSIYPPSVILALHIITYTSSFGPLVYVYLGESIVQQLIPFGSSTKSILLLVITFTFPIATDAFGISIAFYFFAACMLAGCFYLKFELIETKGKSREEIQAILSQKN